MLEQKNKKGFFVLFNLIVTEAPLLQSPISYIGDQQDRGRYTLPLNSSDHRLIKDFVYSSIPASLFPFFVPVLIPASCNINQMTGGCSKDDELQQPVALINRTAHPPT